MSDKPRPQLPEQAAQTIAASITAAIMDGMWDRDCEVVLQTAIARLVSGQVSHIPGVDSRPIPAPPDVETAAGKIATAVTERVNDWDKAAEDTLARWIMVLLQRTIDPLLKALATDVRPCKGHRCGHIIAMVPDVIRGGMLIPFDFGTGTNHFITCPDRERFRRPAGSMDPKQPLPPDPVQRTVQDVDVGSQQALFDRSRRPE